MSVSIQMQVRAFRTTAHGEVCHLRGNKKYENAFDSESAERELLSGNKNAQSSWSTVVAERVYTQQQRQPCWHTPTRTIRD